MLNPSLVGSKIQYDLPAISPQNVDQFKKAILCEGRYKIPLTFWTSYRKPEFEWLERLNIQLKELLHTEQEYQYLKTFDMKQAVCLSTTLDNVRIRKTQKGVMIFVTLTTEIIQQEEVKVISKTVFIARRDREEERV